MRLTIFLAEAKLLDKVTPIYDYPVVREYIGAINDGKVSFPALELEPGVIMLESGDIMNKFAVENGVDPATCWVLNYFNNGMMKSFGALFKAKIEAAGGYPEASAWLSETTGVKLPEAEEGRALKLE
eukprot:CAMPEP_0118970586 /NCGR_PEP_ID=MMETSP1173-20130426/7450_1 /TAXON_ID=1034831 /ORGANISM="Rhizochromulina marina cf, Strain CCMP1243" /LENGTH=126 /DNA_ID=CAMNT_0006919963 /DNA_START=21 /DNA_END=401 /DNA_ORIENTATION=-